ncbi:enoyl-CoA hydratase/isomerase family protein [Pacificispira sp.]|uniref:enoyl-CoA hydratase/isomerase family protein n=1 Tax=Pacificispira sp. TaxID=2888761 RepID=UPI003B522364
MTDQPAVRYEVAHSVATLTLNDPEGRNSLTDETKNGLGRGLTTAIEDEAVRLVVIRNEGHVFCAGANLKTSVRPVETEFSLVQILNLILDSPKPVLAAISGHCIGGGVGLAAACDLSIAVEGAKFGFTEVRLGVTPAIISVVCLPKMRRSDAMELFLTGSRFTAVKAAEVGLINSAVPLNGFEVACEDLINDVLLGGPTAVGICKQLVNAVPGMKREEAFDWTYELSRGLFASDEAAEGIAAFQEKREPKWVPSGR